MKILGIEKLDSFLEISREKTKNICTKFKTPNLNKNLIIGGVMLALSFNSVQRASYEEVRNDIRSNIEFTKARIRSTDLSNYDVDMLSKEQIEWRKELNSNHQKTLIILQNSLNDLKNESSVEGKITKYEYEMLKSQKDLLFFEHMNRDNLSNLSEKENIEYEILKADFKEKEKGLNNIKRILEKTNKGFTFN